MGAFVECRGQLKTLMRKESRQIAEKEKVSARKWISGNEHVVGPDRKPIDGDAMLEPR